MNIIMGNPYPVEIVEINHYGIDEQIVQEVFECGHSITYGPSCLSSPEWVEHWGYAPDSDERRCWQCGMTVESEKKKKQKKTKEPELALDEMQMDGILCQLELF